MPTYLQAFIEYMEENKLSKAIQRTYAYYANDYVRYLEKHKQNLQKMKYKDLLQYISKLQEQGKSKTTVNTHLRAIGYYYRYQKLTDITYDVRLRGVKKEKQLLFTEEELQHIYDNWQNKTPNPRSKGNTILYAYSNQLLLGLIIFQAATKQDLYKLYLSDIDLTKGTIYLSGGNSIKTGRKVVLQSVQIIPLYEYIQAYRGKSERKDYQREADKGKLFYPNANKEDRLRSQLNSLLHQLQKIYPSYNIIRPRAILS